MRVMNVHERIVPKSATAVFAELEAIGTPADRLWPEPKLPFRRTEGPLTVGETTERHGIIRARLDRLETNSVIVWRADQSFLRGTHAFEIRPVDGSDSQTLVRHVLKGQLAWWFVPVWVSKIRRMHDRLVEQLLDRLEQLDLATAPT